MPPFPQEHLPHPGAGSIWTHLLGFLLFLFLGLLTMLRENTYFLAPLQEKAVFGVFLGTRSASASPGCFSICCHSEKVSPTFSQLGYPGVAPLIMGSFVPWLCDSVTASASSARLSPRLRPGMSTIIAAQRDRMATPGP